jgi:GntR family transcriptional regulator, N-acetylglucosamine utilization regulator
MALDRTSSIPLYAQLRRIIESRIASREWSPKSQIPSEAELCEQFSVSRITVRQAIAGLVNEHLLIREAGRGTYVVEPRIEQHVGFSADINGDGEHVGSKVLEFSVVPATGVIGHKLGLDIGSDVILLKRLLLADNTPVSVEIAYFPGRVWAGMSTENLEKRSLYQVLMEKYHIVLTRAKQQIEAWACPDEEAGLLSIPHNSPVLHIYRTAYDQNDQPFECVESFCRGDRYTLHAEFQND